MTTDLSTAVVGLGIGIALAGAPGPVQAVLFSESLRGGVARGLLVILGSATAFGLLLIAAALGLSIATPDPTVVRVIKVAGGTLLLWLAIDGFRSAAADDEQTNAPGRLHPTVRGAMAVTLNAGTWLFLAAVAAPLLATAAQRGGLGLAFLTAVAILVGAAGGDVGFVVLAGAGLRRLPATATRTLRRALAIALGALGILLIADAVRH